MTDRYHADATYKSIVDRLIEIRKEALKEKFSLSVQVHYAWMAYELCMMDVITEEQLIWFIKGVAPGYYRSLKGRGEISSDGKSFS